MLMLLLIIIKYKMKTLEIKILFGIVFVILFH